MTVVWVKICGLTSIGDAEEAADAGANAIGLNFVPGSPRRIDLAQARAIIEAVRGRVEVVGVVANLTVDAIAELAFRVGLDAVQLHGDELPELVSQIAALGTFRVYKAVRLGDREDVVQALAYPGALLVDAKVDGALGGTGKQVDWSLAAELAKTREIVLAGGLNADNVADAIRRVRPFGVDVASGVESAPGVKDVEKMRRFVGEARRA